MRIFHRNGSSKFHSATVHAINHGSVSTEQLEQTLSKLAEVGTLVKNRRMRQVWRFEHAGSAYYLKFYPRRNSILQKIKKIVRGNPAMREFVRLQWLQKANIPAPRAIAVLMGFRIQAMDKSAEPQIGDAVILQAIEPSVTLDQYFNQYHLKGEVPPDYRTIANKLRTLVYNLGKARLGHSDLHLGNFLLQNGEIFLLDAYAVRKDGLHKSDVMKMGHSVARYATVTELLRGWYMLGDGGRLPMTNPESRSIWQTFNNRTTGDGNYFGKIKSAGWSGVFFSNWKYPHRWASASHLTITEADWQREWPILLQQMKADTLQVLKRGDSGDVLQADITLAGKPVSIVLKRPRRRFWYRYINELFRGARGKRAWHKTWNLLIRNIPTAWPLLLIERRVFGYVVDSIIICQHVPGTELASADLDEMTPEDRARFFHRCGKLLRSVESFHYSHFDAKANNWILCPDDKLGPIPVLVDIDGIRYRNWIGLGIERLLRSMKLHKQYTPVDSLNLCRGYAPYAILKVDESPDIINAENTSAKAVPMTENQETTNPS